MWVDAAVAAAVLAPMMHYVAPKQSISGTLILDMLLFAGVAILREKGEDLYDHAKARGIDLFYWLRNSYETTIVFRKEVRFER